ncbi:WGR domain-containing protein (plasmid) [Methylomarinum sp. Ch1-1]|uniref:WGR domain-containing protein n=1 Tax=Methylomarinum roseum TaxID=3067653 RepID=A0AAU7NP55_9GAMM
MNINRLYLEKRDPDRNMQRFYAMHVTQTIFGDWALIREWGRIGSPGTIRENWFDTKKEALEAEWKLLNQKIKKGYSKNSSSALYNFTP